MSAWEPITFFEGEDPEALKTAFVDLCAKHKDHFSAYEVAKYVFKDLKEPEIRALQAAKVWSEDLEVKERIRVAILLGSDSPETNPAVLKRRLLAIADDPKENAKDRIEAIRTIAQMQGDIVKPVELRATDGKGGGGLPVFNIVTYADKED